MYVYEEEENDGSFNPTENKVHLFNLSASFLISLKFECLVLILFPIERFDSLQSLKRITIKDKTNRHGFGLE